MTQISLKDKMSLDNFDPMAIDISEFVELSEKLPQDTNIDLVIAEQLAVLFLRAADRCSEIHSSLIWFTQKVKLDKNTIRQKLYLFAKDEGFKTVEDRKAYAESHDDYVSISETLVKADAVRNWFEDKHKWFLKTHQYMKEKLRAEQQHLSASGFSETSGVNKDGKFGEISW
jgi:hypothetical protein